ncbi:MAG: post-COAP-1 domain-containing protein [Gammaproteobacteria bacterium]
MRCLKVFFESRKRVSVTAALVFAAIATAVFAGEVPSPGDFLTGGGWIMRASGAKANFGVAGGVKNGNWWGHLEYIDHGTGLKVHWTSITGYFVPEGGPYLSPNTRDICGFADTNLYGNVAFHVRAEDNGEPGRNDIFIIRLGKNGVVVYSTEGDPDHTLGGPNPGGGNIQLHKGNKSNTAPSNTPPECDI